MHAYIIIGQYPGPVSNTFLANSFLHSNFNGYSNTLSFTLMHSKTLCRQKYNATSPVLVIQINASRGVELPKNGTVSLTFDILKVQTYISNYFTNHAIVY